MLDLLKCTLQLCEFGLNQLLGQVCRQAHPRPLQNLHMT